MKNKKPNSQRSGRPPKKLTDKRTAEIKVRCLLEEKDKIKSLSAKFGLSISDYVLKTSLQQKIWGNYKELHGELHRIGTEFSRAGNNINQLAKHANSLNKLGKLEKSIVDRLNLILTDYVKKNEAIRVVLRKIVRELTR